MGVAAAQLTFTQLHPLFAAEAGEVDLRTASDPDLLAEIRAGMDEYGVLLFRRQYWSDEEHLAFARRFDGQLHLTTNRVLHRSRLGNDALTDISNLDENGDLLGFGDRRRMYELANRLWHTDGSFQTPRSRYSMLSAKVVPPTGGQTAFADLRAAYEALPAVTKAEIAGLRAYHSIVYSRQTLGFEFSADEADRLGGAWQPLVHTLPGSGRTSLYLASHASHIEGMPIPEGRLLLRELIEHATQRQFVYSHDWRPGDLVIWDNRATMHRGTPFDDRTQRRELHRVTTLDLPLT
ncbi:MAG: TauD/TfdA family dioxygenase [Chloroflexi bacterium]|nr:TauD/TfdA family dioxygenase [Chloroflexota bacterium]